MFCGDLELGAHEVNPRKGILASFAYSIRGQ